MGYCKDCRSYVIDTAKFCHICGSPNVAKDNVIVDADSMIKEKGPWKAFAKVGFIIGIISLAAAILSFMFFAFTLFDDSMTDVLFAVIFGMFGLIISMCTFELGIVFSILGMFSRLRKKFAVMGLVFNIVASVLPWIAVGLIA